MFIKNLFKPRELKKREFQGVIIVLLATLILVGIQSFQLYSLKNVLAKEGLEALGGSASASQSSGIPEQVGGCFR